MLEKFVFSGLGVEDEGFFLRLQETVLDEGPEILRSGFYILAIESLHS